MLLKSLLGPVAADTLVRVGSSDVLPHPMIICFVTGRAKPLHCMPMARDPAPPVGMVFDLEFVTIASDVLVRNPAVHDGAILVARMSASMAFRVAGWSYRLVPPFEPREVMVNRGSAYNSALAMSLTPRIDLVAIAGRGHLECFVGGASLEGT